MPIIVLKRSGRPKTHRWINVDDSLPNINHPILLCMKSGLVSTGVLSKRRPDLLWEIYDPDTSDDDSVIGWAELPVPMKFIELSDNKDD